MKGNPWIYGFRNKLGDSVMYRRGGVQLARAYQPTVANPKTEKQLLARARFSFLSETAKMFRFIVKVGFKAQSNTLISARNVFMRTNVGCVGGTEPDELTFSFEEAKVAKGGLMNVTYGTPNFATPLSVTVPISSANANGEDALVTDIVRIGIVCPDANRAIISLADAHRSDGSITVQVPADMQGQKVHVYGFCEGADSNPSFAGQCSDSFYVGFGTIG